MKVFEQNRNSEEKNYLLMGLMQAVVLEEGKTNFFVKEELKYSDFDSAVYTILPLKTSAKTVIATKY